MTGTFGSIFGECKTRKGRRERNYSENVAPHAEIDIGRTC